MAQSRPRIQGTFYPLASSELLYLGQILTDAELKTLLYLKSIHPFTDRYKELDTAAIAEQLNLHTRSIRRFLKKFKELDLIDWEITQFKYKPLSNNQRIVGSQNGSHDYKTDRRIPKRITGSQNGSQDHFQSPKPLLDKTSNSPQTIERTPSKSKILDGDSFASRSNKTSQCPQSYRRSLCAERALAFVHPREIFITD